MDFVAEPDHERRATRPRPAPMEAGSEHPSRERSPGDSPTTRSVSRLSTGAAVALQRKAGNRAVSRLVAQRRAASVATKQAGPPVPKSGPAIVKQAPKNLDEADEFGDSGKADAVKCEVQGKVGAGKEASAKPSRPPPRRPRTPRPPRGKQVTPLRPTSRLLRLQATPG